MTRRWQGEDGIMILFARESRKTQTLFTDVAIIFPPNVRSKLLLNWKCVNYHYHYTSTTHCVSVNFNVFLTFIQSFEKINRNRGRCLSLPQIMGRRLPRGDGADFWNKHWIYTILCKINVHLLTFAFL